MASAGRKSPEELRSYRWLGKQRSALVRPSLAAAPVRLRPRRLGRQAGHRHHQHLERHQRLPRPFARAGGGRQTRRLSGRRLSDRAACDVARRAVRQTVDHALPQLPRHGVRGVAALPSDRWRGADGRLRQDHARPADGCGQHGRAGDLRAGRADAARQLARPDARLRLRRVEILGRKTRRPHRRRGVERDRGRHFALVRHLHGDGHGRHHDGDRRGARHGAARRVVDPGARRQSSAHVRGRRPPRRRDGVGGFDAGQNSDAGGFRQCHPRAHGARRLDQRHHPRHRARAPRRHRARHGALRRDFAPSAGDRQHHAVRQISDGGFLLCRRLARADGADAGPARSVLPHGQWPQRSARISRAPGCTCPT